MALEDLDRVIENETRSYAFPWTRGVFSDCLKSRHECWVAVRENDLIGHGVLSIGANEAHLLNVCVRRDQQGNGGAGTRQKACRTWRGSDEDVASRV